jgi:hypothetical protein
MTGSVTNPSAPRSWPPVRWRPDLVREVTAGQGDQQRCWLAELRAQRRDGRGPILPLSGGLEEVRQR